MRPLAPLLALLGVAVVPLRATATGEDFFTSKVRPILAKHCFKCHGPDDKARKARLRLDVREEAIKKARSGGRPIVPGRPEQSELVTRIFAEDEEVMPPPRAKLALSGEQKEILKKWIAGGAKYTAHWAFLAPRRGPLPSVKNAAWPGNPIDVFILARLEKEGLAPSPEADRYTLARRLYLDLVGVPPTPAEADAFVRDRSPDAYERLVDRLLASPGYGERWARRWLDLARYADTNGYEKDRPRSIWPYRDWVIGALNGDMPFDRFTVEQLAGDMLPAPSTAQKIATGFHRNTMLNEEGGIDPLEFRFHAMTDRVATTGAVWLGLTLGCAQCHTHKYDPISHKEYYQLFAFLDNCDEPEMAIPDGKVARRRREVRKRIEEMEANLVHQPPFEEKRPASSRSPVQKTGSGWQGPEEPRAVKVERFFGSWYAKVKREVVPWSVLRPVKATANVPTLSILKDGSVLASGDESKSNSYEVVFSTEVTNVTALRLEVMADDRLPNGGPGRVYYEGPPGDFHLSEVTLLAEGRRVELADATQSFASGGNTASRAIDRDPQTGWSINGGQGRSHHAIFRLKAPLARARELKVRLLCERYYAAGLGRFRLAVTSASPPKAVDFPTDLEPLMLLPESKLTAEQRQRLLRQFLRMAPELAAARAGIDRLRRELPAYSTTLVMRERPLDNPRPTFVHHRGEFLQPGERVRPAVPRVLPPLPEGASRNRLTFVRWLVSPDNPLTARVTVNRQWAAFFGRGIVPTLADFGLQGELPSHPDLLDWLALELVREGWSLKRIHRLIVTSSTYRQASRVTPGLLAKDPGNRLLARGPRVRLEAEMVRDGVLRASGLLAEKLGGPSVFPPQPAEVTTEGTYGGLPWRVSGGLDRYRRGLYTFSKRTAPYALFGTFDGPSGEVCVAKREVSNTPLQALTLLNDQAILEAAQELGRRATDRNGSTEARVGWLFRRVLTRPPTPQEVALLARFFRAQWERFVKGELDARLVAGAGEGEVTERAAWTALARVLFNLDEAVVKG
jgi:hypothetical protein